MRELERQTPAVSGAGMCVLLGLIFMALSGGIAVVLAETGDQLSRGEIFFSALIIPVGVLGALIMAAGIAAGLLDLNRRR